MLELESNRFWLDADGLNDLTFMFEYFWRIPISATIPNGIKVKHKYDVWYVPRPDITYVICTSRSTSQHRMGARAPQRPQSTHRGSRLRPYSKLPARTHPRRRPLRLAQRPQPPTTKRHPIQRTARTTLQQVRNQQRHQNSPLRRLQQLVRSLRLLGPSILRRQECSTHQRRTKEMDRRGQTSDQRHTQTRHNQFPRIQSRREHQSLPPTGTRPSQKAQRQVRRRQKPQGVQRRSTSTPRIPNRTRAAWGPHTRRS